MQSIYSYYLKKKCFPKIRIVYKYQYLFFFLKRKNHFFIYLKKKRLKKYYSKSSICRNQLRLYRQYINLIKKIIFYLKDSFIESILEVPLVSCFNISAFKPTLILLIH